MTSPPEKILLLCPSCGKPYEDWYRPSINLMLDDFDDEYLEEAATSTCPFCKHKVRHEVLVVREDGVWEIQEGKEGGAVPDDQPGEDGKER